MCCIQGESALAGFRSSVKRLPRSLRGRCFLTLYILSLLINPNTGAFLLVPEWVCVLLCEGIESTDSFWIRREWKKREKPPCILLAGGFFYLFLLFFFPHRGSTREHSSCREKTIKYRSPAPCKFSSLLLGFVHSLTFPAAPHNQYLIKVSVMLSCFNWEFLPWDVPFP